LNIARFRDSALRPLDHPRRPTRGLMSVICLIGFLLSTFITSGPTPAQIPQLTALLSRAISEITNMITTESSHPFVIVQNIQAEVLLATYLFCSGRHLEGQFHLTRANSIAIGARLHKIRSDRERPYPNDIGHTFISPSSPAPSGLVLPPTSDPIEEGERINAFWVAFTLSNCWDATVASSMSLISVFGEGNMEVDSPWPMDMPQYEQGGFPPKFQDSWTVQKFLSHVLDDTSPHEISNGAMYAKASVLFKRSRRISSQLQGGTGAFTAILELIDSFISRLPPISTELATWERPTSVGVNLVTHTLAHSSTIQLHSVLMDAADHFSLAKSLMAARACVRILNNEEVAKYLQSLRWINPIMGILWDGVCAVFLKCMGKLRSGSMDSVSTMAQTLGVVNRARVVEQQLVQMFEEVIRIMQQFEGRHLTISRFCLSGIGFLDIRLTLCTYSGAALEKNLSAYRALQIPA
ncbi:hypothetical protein L218DRAFT_871275, partial [Marasmius fiardii PR-910]